MQDLLTLSDAELAQLDIAEVNLLCAKGLPGTEDIDIPEFLCTLDRWAEKIRDATQRCPWFQNNPEKYDGSVSLFRIHVMVSVLQRDCGVRYNPERIPEEATLYPEDVFIHGMLKGSGGTCASLPVLYTAVGRRLGYPLKLSHAKNHLFFRWEDSQERFNVEATNNGFNDYPDEYYLTGRYEITPQEVKDGCHLISLSPKQELAGFIEQRGFCWLDLKNYKQAVESFLWASILDSENCVPARLTMMALRQWQNSILANIPPNFPRVDVGWQLQRFPGAPEHIEEQVNTLEGLQRVLDEPAHQPWWQSLRQSPNQRPTGVPRHITIELHK
jgi:hypothetical protein